LKLILHGSRDIERAARLAGWLNRPAVSDVAITLPSLDRCGRARLETAIKRYFNDCGCLWATASFLAVLLWSLLANPWASSSWTAWLNTMLAAVAGALGGKIIGLSWSWWRLTALLRRLRRRAASWH
jgi:hypothetical protein